MSFALKAYWIFLFLVVIGVWSLPVRLRKPWLLLSSYVFYAIWSVPYLGLLVTAAALNHFGAAWIIAGDRNRRGKLVIAGNLLLLGVFKYAAWIIGSFTSAASWFGVQLSLPIPRWALPLGISFYLFESISYIIDVMRKREKLHSFWDFQLFIAFFPKLIAGPILRAKEFLPQIERSLHLRPVDVRLASREIIIGLFLKLVLADAIGGLVDNTFARQPTDLTAIDVWLMGLGFMVQVYLDFSAYTRMAIGSAKLCGIDLVENFDHPFVATSPADFWRRWHMSLSRWIRDYLFYPIAQDNGTIDEESTPRAELIARLRLMWAAFVSMVIFGVWHGAGWTYLVYGVYHGALLAAYQVVTDRAQKTQSTTQSTSFARLRAAAVPFLGWLVTFPLLIIGFIIFRATSLADALALIGRALRPFAYPGRTLKDYMVFRTVGLTLIILAIGFVARRKEAQKPKKRPANAKDLAEPPFVALAVEGVGLGILLVLALLQMVGKDAKFVYFQF